MNVMLDSSVCIKWLREQRDIRVMLRPWIVRGECFMCGVVRAEVLRGVIRAPQHDRLGEIFDVMCEAPLGSAFWKRVTNLAWNLDRRGVILPLPDLAIAQAAIDCEATLITLDKHFAQIPKLTILKELPPV